MRPLYDPSSSTIAGQRAASFAFLPPRFDVGRVSPVRDQLTHVVVVVAFVGAEVLGSRCSGNGALDGHAVERGFKQPLVVRVGRFAGDPVRDARAVGQDRSFHARLRSIGRIWTGFFPRPAALWSSPRRCSGSPTECPSNRRTPRATCATAGETRRAWSTAENNDASCCRNRTPAVQPSTGSLSVARRRCRPPRPASTDAA